MQIGARDGALDSLTEHSPLLGKEHAETDQGH
jgi:hypothetical protein